MGKKVLAAKSGRAACSCTAAGGGIAAKNAKGAKTKPSGIPWIGDIPERWEIGRLKSVLIANDGGVWGDDPLDDDSDIIVLRSTEQSIDGRLIIEAPAKRQLLEGDKEKSLLKEGDLIITKSSGSQEHIGKTSIIDKTTASMRCCYSNFLQRLRVEGSSLFFWYVMNSYMVKMQFDYLATTTTGLKNLNAQIIGNLQISLPPLSEQRAIAAYLDEKCGAIAAAVAEAKKGIEEYKAWKISLIDDVVCNGIVRHDVRKETGEVWLEDIPGEWDFTQIRYLFALRDERNDKPLKDVNLISLYTDKGVVQHADLEKTTGNKASTADGYKLVYENDIVVNIILCWMGAVGRSAYNGVTSPAYDVYRPIDPTKVLSRYYHYLFRTPRFNGKCYEEGRGIMMMRWRTYSSEFRAIKVPVPPIEEQRAIADHLDEKCAAIDAMVTEKESLIADLEAYKKSLIFEVVTGKREVASNSMVK